MSNVSFYFLQVGKLSKEWGRGPSLFPQNMGHSSGTTAANVVCHSDSRTLKQVLIGLAMQLLGEFNNLIHTCRANRVTAHLLPTKSRDWYPAFWRRSPLRPDLSKIYPNTHIFSFIRFLGQLLFAYSSRYLHTKFRIAVYISLLN